MAISSLNDVLNIFRQVSVEPFLFFFMFGYFTRLVSYQSILIERACTIELNYSQQLCQNLDEDSQEGKESLQFGVNLFLGSMVISTVPAFIASTFLGPWSDIYGRRYAMILSNTGIFINAILTAIVASIPSASPYWFLAADIPSGICGGMLVSLSSSYSYMSDITNERTRPTRYAILEFFFIMAMPLGTVIGGQVYSSGGYVPPMVLSACGFACSLLWAILMVKETIKSKTMTSKKEVIKDLLRIDNVVASYKTCAQKRPGNLRLQLWLLVFISCVAKLVNIGNVGIGFNFAKKMFSWGVERYSNTVTMFYIFDAFATLVIVPTISRKLQLHEAAIGFIGILSLMAKLVLFAVSFQEGIYYYAWCTGIFNPCSGIAIRSRISKLVSKQELGRVFSLLATCESLTPVLGTVVMGQIYNASFDTYPGLVFAICSVLLVPPAVIFGWMTKLPTVSFAEYTENENKKRMQELHDVSAFENF